MTVSSPTEWTGVSFLLDFPVPWSDRRYTPSDNHRTTSLILSIFNSFSIIPDIPLECRDDASVSQSDDPESQFQIQHNLTEGEP